MKNNKKGLSTVVTTLVIILLVLVAIGIIWIVVRGAIEEGTGAIDSSVKCLEIDVIATSVICSSDMGFDICNVTLDRSATGDDMGGVKLVFKNTTSSTSGSVITITQNIAPLGGYAMKHINTTLSAPDKVEVTVFLLDEAGEEQLCTTARTLKYA